MSSYEDPETVFHPPVSHFEDWLSKLTRERLNDALANDSGHPPETVIMPQCFITIVFFETTELISVK